MPHHFPRAVLLVLALYAFSASAQDAGRGELSEPRFNLGTSSPVMPAQDAGGKTRVGNAGAADGGAAGKVAGPGREVLQQQTVLGAEARRPPPLSEFQKFVADGTGKILPIFGTEFFIGSPTTFAPIANSPVPADYPLGPGDEILVRGWGSIDIDYRGSIDRNGLINMPTFGSIVLGGVKAGDAEMIIRSAVGRLYKGVNLSVNFGQMRAITVYVVGQAQRPGTYTVSNMSTLVTALFASGGPNQNGSMRKVQLKRAGKVSAELDLYSFIARGDKASDIRLQDGDVIFIPPASGYVALTGKVNTPAIYELHSAQDTVASLLEFAGGMPIVADPRRAFLERIDPRNDQPRSVEQFALDAAGLQRLMKNGDLLNVTSITPDFSDAVILRGNVDQPVRAHFKAGMRISDLIPSRSYLISRASTQRRNNALTAQEATTAGVEGGPAGARPADSAARPGAATSIAARIGGSIEEINWDYAVVERLDRNKLTVSLIPFNLGKVFDDPAGGDNLLLQAGDVVTILSQDDVAVPIEKRRVIVRIEGEVNVPGVYQMKRGEDLHDLLARAGGPTRSGYVFGTAFYRERVRIEQQANMEKVIDRLETQLRIEEAKGVANTYGMTEGGARALEVRRTAELANARETVQRLRKLAATGRISLGLDPAGRSFNTLPHLKLEDGDRLVVPFRPEFVHIFGAVNSESSPLWRPGLRVSDYLDKAGLRPEASLEDVFILKIDGSVIGGAAGGWFLRGPASDEIGPGDSIVVPEKNAAKEGFWSRFTNGTKEWAQIFANFGLGAAALKVLR